MNRKYINNLPTCEWCGTEMTYRKGKRYCCKSCACFGYRNQIENPPAKKERKKVLGYIKRRKDVIQFADYLKLIKRYNKQYSNHLSCEFKGNKAKYLNISYKMLKCDTPNKYSRDIDSYLKSLENSN